MLKLYVLIRDDLTEAQQAVQAGHAVAQFSAEFPDEFKDWNTGNNTLIYLSVTNIGWWIQVLSDGEFKFSVFHEPDLGTICPSSWGGHGAVGVSTAIAVAPNWTTQYLLFKDLPLALKPKRKKWWQR